MPLLRESRLQKASRLLKTGKVEVVLYVHEELWTCIVEGDHGTYLVRKTPEAEDCECDSFQHRHICPHFEAAESAVTFYPRQKEGASQ